MKYFFVLGANPTLSIAELSAVFGLSGEGANRPIGHLPSENIFIMEIDKEIDCPKLIKRLGGTIKIGAVNHESKTRNYEDIKNKIAQSLETGKIKSKFKFGISYYGKAKFNIKPLAMEIKNYLRGRNANSRWVTSREPTLSSVVVEQNKLTSTGIEIVLIESEGGVLIGQTLTVQPFKELSFRDYGRPARDDKSGMLPPKLAQIMINLSGMAALIEQNPDAALIDPFCGSGTILTEAMLMGCKNLIGSDVSPKAIQDTEKNIQWIKTKFQVSSFKFQLFNIAASDLSKRIKPNSIDIIATEPYLGPQRGKIDIERTVKELETLYGRALTEFKKALKKDGGVVMVWPAFSASWRIRRGKPALRFINPNLSGFKIINPIPNYLRENKIIKLTDRNTIIYGREGQRVWREIVILH